tara:strand:- start:4571 stop:5248 length:678 start_codon:yes stop_codon:yes gene_type:complete
LKLTVKQIRNYISALVNFNVLLITLLSVSNISCSNKPSKADFRNSIASEFEKESLNQSDIRNVAQQSYQKNEKSFIVDKEINGLIIQLKNIPVELLALKELKNTPSFSKTQLDSVIKSYGEIEYFNLQFTSKTSNLYRDIKGKYKPEMLQNILNSKISSSFKLDSVHLPVVFHYNSTMGVFPGFSFFIGFEKSQFQKSKKLIIEKSIFNETKIEIDITSLANSKS